MTMSETRWKSLISSKSLLAIALLAAIIGFGLLAWGQQTDSLPIIITGCVISLIAAVMFMVIVFSFHDLEDRTQALGLPEGSVRALIALMLLVIFAVFASAFFSKLSETGGATTDTSGTPSATGTDATGTSGTGGTAATTETAGTTDPTDTSGTTQTLGTTGTTTTTGTTGTTAPAPTATGTAATNTTAPATTVSVTPSNLDFARQIIAIIGTLLTAVISFYFGSRSSAAATPEQAPPSRPALIISPKTARRESTGRFEISGIDVAAKSASLKRDAHVIEGAALETTPEKRLGVTFTIPSDAPTGSWDLVVELADGKKATLSDAITVT